MGGPNLLRSQLALNDLHGELIIPVVQRRAANAGHAADAAAAAARPTTSRRSPRTFTPSQATIARTGLAARRAAVQLNIVVGDAKAGQAYFAANVHAPATRLQATCRASRRGSPIRCSCRTRGWAAAAGADAARRSAAARRATVTVAVTLPNGQRVEGRSMRYDDFIVILTTADGTQRSFAPQRRRAEGRSHGSAAPGIGSCCRRYTDKDMHDVTAYLVTLK